MAFKKLKLISELLRAIEEQGYTEPTPVQQQAIPIILDGNDLLAGSQTGTGGLGSNGTENSVKDHFLLLSGYVAVSDFH